MTSITIGNKSFTLRVVPALDLNPCKHCSFSHSLDCPAHHSGVLICCDVPNGYISLESTDAPPAD